MSPSKTFKGMIRTASLTLFVMIAASHIAVAQAADPVPDVSAVVLTGEVRFTLLTPRLIRLEWASGGNFEDHASLVFINRRLPVPEHSVQDEHGWLVVKTEALVLRYKIGSGKFTGENLSVTVLQGTKEVLWKPGMPNSGNLYGTTRTLDGVKGSTTLEPGLLSRDGWVLVDDSERPLLDSSDWPWVMPRPSGDRQDWYFFGYGQSYKEQLYDFTRVAGEIPMPPRFAFGLWWSRYWAYTDQEFKDLVREFDIHNVPLDVLVIDMDWHLTFNMRWQKEVRDQAGQRLGWTGYTWDKNFFPDPEGFLAWCASRGLKTPLNLHPASGIQPHELHYPEMARAMGIDPATKKYVPFDIVDKKFAVNYLDQIIRPLERQGVDFWWLDWQAWGTTTITGVTPTWWLNYVFFTDMERKKGDRPLLFHRWGGLGNHRYQIGFSGDAVSVWESLAFQPYFTATASNVGFGYWSHDIGGHMPGNVSGELYSRWIQFGAFSPIVRTHTTKNPEAERRIWIYPNEYFMVMRDAILQRYALIPYIYTAAREAYDTGVSICRPMYYEHPKAEEAYTFKDEYYFGDDMIVAPVAAPVSTDTLAAAKQVWIPEGEWVEWYTGARVRGPGVFTRSFAVDEIPVYVRAGAIIPMQPDMRYTGEKPVDPLILTIFEGDSGKARVYEDQGNSLGYQTGECAWTNVRQSRDATGNTSIAIAPVSGSYSGMPAERSFELRLVGYWPPAAVTCNGVKVPRAGVTRSGGWQYDGDQGMVIIPVPRTRVTERITVTIEGAGGSGMMRGPEGIRGMIPRLRRVMNLINSQWSKEWSPELLVSAVQTGNRMSVDPGRAREEYKALVKSIPEIVQLLPALQVSDSVRTRARAHLGTLLTLTK